MNSDPIHILLVDDDEDNLVLYRDMLADVTATIEAPPHRIEWVGSYERALDIMAANRHDVYLLDYRLGAHDGLTLMREAMQRACRGPYILLTGYGDRAVDLDAMKSGAADFLDKDKITGLLLERAVRYAVERHRSQQALAAAERLATVGAMAARLAHEIRNPLGSILLNMDLLLEEADSNGGSARPELASLCRSIDAEVRRIQRTCEGYLGFARPPKLQQEMLDLNAYLAEKLTTMQPLFDEAHVIARIELATNVPRFLADKDQLWQAVLNLARNAMDAMPAGGTLTVCSRRAGDDLLLEIGDTGSGMTEEQQKQLFKPFVTTKFAGTGLGLSVTQQIIFEHGGRIECVSAPQQGTTFTIRIPLEKTHA